MERRRKECQKEWDLPSTNKKVCTQNESASRVNIQPATEIGLKIRPKGLNQKHVRVLMTEV